MRHSAPARVADAATSAVVNARDLRTRSSNANSTGSATWIASYPRSGNTWARLALLSLRRNGELIDLDEVVGFGRMTVGRELWDEWLQIDSRLLSSAELTALRARWHERYFSGAQEPQLTKVHDCWRRDQCGASVFPRDLTHAAVYLVRDPRDVAVSWAWFCGRPLDEAIAFMADGGSTLCRGMERAYPQIPQKLGTWSEHVESWLAQSDLAPLLVRYEDMIADPIETLERIARHIGWNPDSRALAGAVAATRFSRLAAQERHDGFAERPRTTDAFFRSGRSGGWQTQLSAEQVQRIEQMHGYWMEKLGYL